VPSYANATTDFPVYGLPAVAIANLPAGTVQATLDALSSEADGSIAGQFVLPLKQFPPELTKYVCWMAALELMSVRGYNPEDDRGLLISRDKRAREWLDKVSKGLISPPGMIGADGNNEDQSGAGDLTSDPLRGWQCTPPNNTSTGNNNGGGFWGD
jgi:phage gp36-like protein